MIGSKPGDPRVQRLLEELELKYEVDSDGDFQVPFQLEEGRSHVAFICSNTTHFGKFEIREIFAVAHITDGPLDPDLANALLLMNAHVKFGSWRTMNPKEDQYVIAFAAQLAANTDSSSLITAIHAVLQTADELEAKLDEEDRF
jgi:hypothetical protein